MKKQLLMIPLLTFLVIGCNSSSTNNKEKELLQKEIELLKRENKLLEKDVTSQEKAKHEQEQKTEIIEVESIDSNYLIVDKSVGKFKIGNQIPYPNTSESYEIKKETKTRMTEEGPQEETIYIVNENANDLLIIKPGYNYETGGYTSNIGEIIVLSDKFKTLDGIGINSTINDFIHVYPNYKIWYTYVSEMYVIDTKDINAQFILNGKDFIGKMKINSDMTTLKKADFKSSSKISKIRIF